MTLSATPALNKAEYSGSFLELTAAETAARLQSDVRTGLTGLDAASRRTRFGANEVPEEKPHTLRILLSKFWGLTAWMLELIIGLSWILGKTADVVIVAGLLFINALIGFFQERKAAAVVGELKSRLQVRARALREGLWIPIPARELVPGDIVRLRSGDIVPADAKIIAGGVTVDQSALTGESLALTKGEGEILFGGSMLRRGEATGIVLRTGAATEYGKTLGLVRTARPRLHMEEVVALLVRRLLGIVGGLLAATLLVSVLRGLPLLELLPLLLVLLLGAIPVALPVMFTVSMAVGARALARENVLITRLTAIEDAATMDVLCIDKTGTLTLNEIVLSHVEAQPPYHEEDVLLFGALASQQANQDPLDRAFFAEVDRRGLSLASTVQERFVPFDAGSRRTEAEVRKDGALFRVRKGAVAAIVPECGLDPEAGRLLQERIDEYAGRGYKTLAVSVQKDAKPVFVGWAALGDGLRTDSKELIRKLQGLGLSVKMLTGDALPIARQIALEAGIARKIARMADLKKILTDDPPAALRLIEESGGFAEVFPEDKYLIVRSLQAGRHIVGMTGDGVNDAPALKQAEVGIAVNSATDIARAAAGVVLTGPGLAGIVDLVRHGREVYQRIKTWFLNKIMRTILKSTFVVGVFLVTGEFVISASAMVLLLLMTDFVKISLSTDRVRGSDQPETWDIKGFITVAIVLGAAMALESIGLLALGLRLGHLAPGDPTVRTFSFLILFLSAMGSIFVVRERRHFWSSAPSRVLGTVVTLDLMVGILLAGWGVPGALPPLPLALIVLAVIYNLVFALGLNDFLKVALLKKMGVR